LLGEGVFVPSRVAALLSRALDLDRQRVAWRGDDAEVDAVLNAWQRAALAFVDGRVRRSSESRNNADSTISARSLSEAGCDVGFGGATGVAHSPQPVVRSNSDDHELGSADVAALLAISEQAVTKAARGRRLPGRQVAGRWMFTAAAVASYDANRSK